MQAHLLIEKRVPVKNASLPRDAEKARPAPLPGAFRHDAQLHAGLQQLLADAVLLCEEACPLGLVFRHERGQTAGDIGQTGKGKPDTGRLWRAGRQSAKAALGFGKGRLRLGHGLPGNLPGHRIPVDTLEGRGHFFLAGALHASRRRRRRQCQPAPARQGFAGRLAKAVLQRAGKGWLLKAHSVCFSTSSTADASRPILAPCMPNGASPASRRFLTP